MNANGTKHAPIFFDHVELVKEYASIVRGEHPGWEGDAVRNGESFAFRLGLSRPDDALDLIRSIGISEKQYSMITGLPPASLRWLASQVKLGIRAAKAEGGQP